MDPQQFQRILRQHVRTDALLGLDELPCAATATDLRPPADPTTAPAAPPIAAASSSNVAAAVEPAAPLPSPPARSANSADPANPADPADPPIEPIARMDTKAKQAALDALDQQEVRSCTKCPLHQSRTQTVFGEGDPDAAIMFVGEGPGQNEDEQGRPFVGRAGELLNKMIEAMGYRREDVYITNIVKSRPPNNRAPTPAEVAACWPYLRRQIEIIRPKVIVTLGGPAAKALLETKEGITRLRGTWHEYVEVQPPIPIMPTFHPAYLLRAYTHDNRAKVWADLQAVRDHVAGRSE